MPDKNIIDNLSIDCVIFGFDQSRLQLLLVKHGEGIGAGQWGLPGGWVAMTEDLDESAHRILNELTGIQRIYLEQLRAFGSVRRYPSYRVVTIAYFALVNPSEFHLIPGFTASEAAWFPVDEVPDLLYDHSAILSFALDHLRVKVRHEPIGFNLLPEEFTLLDLQQLYEAVLQQELEKSNFRRKVMKTGLLKKSGKKQRDVPHRAATLYSFDEHTYQKLLKNGVGFEY